MVSQDVNNKHSHFLLNDFPVKKCAIMQQPEQKALQLADGISCRFSLCTTLAFHPGGESCLSNK